MWTGAFFVGLVLGTLVLAVGYGQVLLYNLVLRVLLVVVGTTLTIVAARKAVDAFLSTGSSKGLSAPQVKEVNLGDLDEVESSSPEEAAGAASDPDLNEASEGSEIAPDLEDDSDIEELADMVSETMEEDEEDEIEGDTL